MRVGPDHPLVQQLSALRNRLVLKHEHERAYGVSLSLITVIRWIAGKPLEPTNSDFARLEDGESL